MDLDLDLNVPFFQKYDYLGHLENEFGGLLSNLSKTKKELKLKLFTKDVEELESAVHQLRKDFEHISNNGLKDEFDRITNELSQWEVKLIDLDRKYEVKCEQKTVLEQENEKLAKEFKNSKTNLRHNLSSLRALNTIYKISLDLKIIIEETTCEYVQLKLIYFANSDKENENYFAIVRQNTKRNFWSLEDMCPKSYKFPEIAKLLLSTSDIQGCVATIQSLFLQMKN